MKTAICCLFSRGSYLYNVTQNRPFTFTVLDIQDLKLDELLIFLTSFNCLYSSLLPNLFNCLLRHHVAIVCFCSIRDLHFSSFFACMCLTLVARSSWFSAVKLNSKYINWNQEIFRLVKLRIYNIMPSINLEI